MPSSIRRSLQAQRSGWKRCLPRDPAAVAVVESALIFEVERDARQRGESEGVLADWRRRFDRIIVVTAPDEVRVSRYVSRLTQGQFDERIAADAAFATGAADVG